MKLEKEELKSVKKSFLNILALFMQNEKIDRKFVACLLKWSAQLNLSDEDLLYIENNFDHLEYKEPKSRLDKIDSIYHLVHMIYLDNVVEDIELEVATIYAVKLGFNASVVGELFKAIATAPYDGKNTTEVHSEIKEFLELNNM
ncbi:hypothetical protein LVD15_15035 [Fulvivirga maritima]|uniref:hypothetical protein n=1 Tax=Fulvivirga maritima TaxID=2904247 RepID=UPI001F3FB4D3|nr:hypothetical protein [Fulvivirga maritima]UII24637.1 hypothetical protein LVD15_15035 [Fulvivirga maritima]